MKRYLGCKCKKLLPFSTKVARCPVCQHLYRIVSEREVEQQRLVTAAPALVEACKAALLILDADGHTDPWGERRAIREQVQAALALAEPTQPEEDDDE